ncbi:MAG TPA: flavodoxin-dependent (E)-4-hydroxy-3-methylbut-2-enyl-diphosphate synthase [Clostridiales bacterium]|jgi:(E)-4-hydroxy-3-methylbut-2-enyl-diphosphate synthase|nr:flavodoxin-dependent (E)-4-hydroxy-3-methylbut-2-enyl-diphosphate synthase [Clostridiales bacterium]
MVYNEIRAPKREVKIGRVTIGGGHKIAIQSMTNTKTEDREATLRQVLALERAGCDIIRVSVPSTEAVLTIGYLKEKGIRTPVVADIHYDHRLAVLAAEQGTDKIRINPGNLGGEERLREVCRACRSRGIPIRVGVNSGSLERQILKKHGAPTAGALCESALLNIALLEKYDFSDIVISIKSSDVKTMIDANLMLSEKCDYPLHLGVTEAGAGRIGLMKSAAGVGALLCSGVGDTIRISLTDDPLCEVSAARELLTALGFEGQRGLNIISCPTCARTSIDLIELCRRFEAAARREGLLDKPLNVALMGCAVNGPGEAREADVGIAGGAGEALLFKRGRIVGKIKDEDIIDRLINEIKDITK